MPVMGTQERVVLNACVFDKLMRERSGKATMGIQVRGRVDAELCSQVCVVEPLFMGTGTRCKEVPVMSLQASVVVTEPPHVGVGLLGTWVYKS